MPASISVAAAVLALFVAPFAANTHNLVPRPKRQGPEIATVTFTPTSIAIDGLLDSAWSRTSSLAIDNRIGGSPADGDDISGNFKVMYSASTLYVLYVVTDDTIVRDSGDALWHDDSVEIYIDSDFSRGASYDDDDRHFHMRAGESTFGFGVTSAPLPAGSQLASDITPNGYVVEAAFPLAGLGIDPNSGDPFGLDVQLNDDDNGGLRERNYAWSSRLDIMYYAPSSFGIGRFGPAQATPTPAATLTPQPTAMQTPRPTATQNPLPTIAASATPAAPTQTLAPGVTATRDVAAPTLTPQATLLASVPRYFLPIVVGQVEVNNQSACLALRLTPPTRYSQPASAATNWYRFTAAKDGYAVVMGDFPSTGSLVAFRIDADRCGVDGTISQSALASASLRPNHLASIDLFGLQVGADYLIVVYTTGALSRSPYALTVQ
jgi:hypothetical protein